MKVLSKSTDPSQWDDLKINEYIAAIDPEYYNESVIRSMSKQDKLSLILDLEYNYVNNSHK